MEEITPSQREFANASKPVPLLLCPDCMKSIPFLLIRPLNGQLNFYIGCSCFDNCKKASLSQFIKKLHENRALSLKLFSNKAETNCVTGQDKFNKEEILTQEINVECSIHKKPFKYYCKSCRINTCGTCVGIHLKHQLVKLCPVIVKEPQTNVFEEINKKNKTLTSQFIKRSDVPDAMKADIQLACDANESINADLEQLYLSLCQTASTYQNYPSYQLMILQTIVINTEEYIEQGQLRTEEEYLKLKKYFQNSFLLKQAVTNESFSILPNKFHVNYLLQLKDGRLASCVNERFIKLWDTSTNKLIGTLTGHERGVTSLVQLIDGRLASGSYDHTIKLWDVISNECLVTLKGHKHNVTCVIQLKDERLASCSGDETIKLWSLTTNECTATLTGHFNWIYSLVELNDGRLTSSANSLCFKLWNTSTNECITTLHQKNNIAQCLIQLSDGRLAFCSEDDSIKVLNSRTNKCLATLRGHKHGIKHLIQLKDGRLASCSHYSTINLWSTTSYKCIITLTFPGNCDYSFLRELDDGRLASGGQDSITIWDI